MNAEKAKKKPNIKKLEKQALREKYEMLPWKERMKAKYLNTYFLQRVIIWIFRFVLMVGISYIVIFPFITWISGSIMAPSNLNYGDVRLIPRDFSIDIYRMVIEDMSYFEALGNTFVLSLIAALLQTFTCCWIGYGFAKFKFRGRGLVFLLVMLTMIIPHQTLQRSMYLQFHQFDVLGIVRFLNGGGIEIFGWNVKELGEGVKTFFESIDVFKENPVTGKVEIPLWYEYNVGETATIEIREAGINIARSYLPMILMSLGGLAFKNGLYIFLLRQFFRGIPDELEESAYIDGCGTFHTFFRIILPLSIPMLITVFLFSFCWQWTDTFYVNQVLDLGDSRNLLIDLISRTVPEDFMQLATKEAGPAAGVYKSMITNTCGLMIIFPLVILYAFCQKFLVQGIEHSGIAN